MSPFTVTSIADEIAKAFHPEAIAAFLANWDHLPADAYLSDGGMYRYRRYGRFSIDLKGSDVFQMRRNDFFQDRDINSANGGYVRNFEPLLEAFSRDPILWYLVSHCLHSPIVDFQPCWEIGVHVIRVIAAENSFGLPSPEGIHRDGHMYVGQFLISRENVAGGESQIYSEEKNLLTSVTLNQQFQLILLNDQQCFHNVTAISRMRNESPAFRDMLLLDFNKPQQNNDAPEYAGCFKVEFHNPLGQ